MDGHQAVSGDRRVDTRWHGTLAVPADRLLHCAIRGFPTDLDWILLTLGPHQPFLVLQSADRAALTFIVCDPWVFWPTYSLPDVIAEVPGRPGDRAVLVLCQFRPVPSANLLAPLVLDRPTRRGRQVILTGPYAVRTPFPVPSSLATAVKEVT